MWGIAHASAMPGPRFVGVGSILAGQPRTSQNPSTTFDTTQRHTGGQEIALTEPPCDSPDLIRSAGEKAFARNYPLSYRDSQRGSLEPFTILEVSYRLWERLKFVASDRTETIQRNSLETYDFVAAYRRRG
jgi:hypothetical protein